MTTIAHPQGIRLHKVPGDPVRCRLAAAIAAAGPQIYLAAAARVTLDWRNATVGEPAPCVLCGCPALCRSPATGAPCHKVCAETLVTGPYGPVLGPPANPMLDRPFWCETCGVGHPLREHRLCRERAAERSGPGCDPEDDPGHPAGADRKETR